MSSNLLSVFHLLNSSTFSCVKTSHDALDHLFKLSMNFFLFSHFSYLANNGAMTSSVNPAFLTHSFQF